MPVRGADVPEDMPCLHGWQRPHGPCVHEVPVLEGPRSFLAADCPLRRLRALQLVAHAGALRLQPKAARGHGPKT